MNTPSQSLSSPDQRIAGVGIESTRLTLADILFSMAGLAIFLTLPSALSWGPVPYSVQLPIWYLAMLLALWLLQENAVQALPLLAMYESAIKPAADL